MTLHFCGYLPKKATPLPEGYDLPGVVEIASISVCIAPAPEDWIQSYAFNALGFFDELGLAESVIPEADRSQFDIYAYEFHDERFARGLVEAWAMPPLDCQPPGADFQPLGFDVVSKSVTDFFECSPLSCNGEAQTFRANAHCLFDGFDEAVAAAQAFSKDEPEPGPYYIARVLRRRRASAP
jgi:hypothetical protein